MSADKNIYLYNDGKPFTAMWDGKEYEIGKEPLEIRRGIAEHWAEYHKDAQLRVEEIPQEEIEKRKPANPLEENNRGEAFATIKRTRKNSEG